MSFISFITQTPLVTSTKRVRPPADEPVAVSPAAKRPKAMMPKGKKGEAAIVVNSRSNKATKEQQPPSRSSASKTTRSAVAGKAAPASPVKVITSASKATPVAKSTTPVAKSTSPVARKTTSASRSITSAAKIFSVGSSSPVKESPPSAESTPAADVVTSRNQPASAVKTRHDSSNESREKSKAMETREYSFFSFFFGSRVMPFGTTRFQVTTIRCGVLITKELWRCVFRCGVLITKELLRCVFQCGILCVWASQESTSRYVVH